MDKRKLVTLLSELNYAASTELNYEGKCSESFAKRYADILRELQCTHDIITQKIPSLTSISYSNNSIDEGNYICLNFYIFELLNDISSQCNLTILSVQETKSVKASLKILIDQGILKNLQPNLPHSDKNAISKDQSFETVIRSYNFLKCTVLGLIGCIDKSSLRMLILPECLQGILVAIFQLAHCPLKKPAKAETSGNSAMSEATYSKLVQDQQFFKEIFEKLCVDIHPTNLVKEIMFLFQTNAPLWFKKSVSNTLTKMLRRKNGVKYVALAMLDGCDDDVTKTWKIINVLTKLIMSCQKLPDFQENICAQILDLLHSVKATDGQLLLLERFVVSCVKDLYIENKDLCTMIFLKRTTIPLLHFAYKEHKFRDGDGITDDIKQSVRLLYGYFVDVSANQQYLPLTILKHLINVIFVFYHLTVKSPFRKTNKELKEILLKYLQHCTSHEINLLLDNFLFGVPVTDILQFRDDVIVEINKEINVKHADCTVIYATAEVADTIFNLFHTDLKISFFGYLLECITDDRKYLLVDRNSKELLSGEDHATSTVLERLLTIHRVLSQLAEDRDVQNSLRTKPDEIIKYISNVLSQDCDDRECLFTVIMILDNLITNSSVNVLPKYNVFQQSLSKVAENITNYELKSLCNAVLCKISARNMEDFENAGSAITVFDQALEDLCSPLLPVRGHGLLMLSKLVRQKDQQAMERKQYLLNMFQLSLKEEDSYIYLNAVEGLAALGDVFPDTVLELLCEEYVDCDKRRNETRMKLGEALVRVVKLLGDMAPKYKALLLNTFLSEAKDDDHLMRASSLSNLGELCRILNYKVGTIITEVLVCVHGIIATDKAIEARRAAVTVIRQLFIGLQAEMISFLKEDILPIYRTLKEVYYHDKDDVMRLQAQLALEELNENMKGFVFPSPQLNLQKKVITLN